jgi:hypothetical protein
MPANFDLAGISYDPFAAGLPGQARQASDPRRQRAMAWISEALNRDPREQTLEAVLNRPSRPTGPSASRLASVMSANPVSSGPDAELQAKANQAFLTHKQDEHLVFSDAFKDAYRRSAAQRQQGGLDGLTDRLAQAMIDNPIGE